MIKKITIAVEYANGSGALVLDRDSRPETEGVEQRAWDRIVAAVNPFELIKTPENWTPLYVKAETACAVEEDEDWDDDDDDCCDCGCCDDDDDALAGLEDANVEISVSTAKGTVNLSYSGDASDLMNAFKKLVQ